MIALSIGDLIIGTLRLIARVLFYGVVQWFLPFDKAVEIGEKLKNEK